MGDQLHPALEGDAKPPSGGKKALEILRRGEGIRVATLRVGDKRRIAAAFAKRGLPVYGQAFDAVFLEADAQALDLKDSRSIEQHLDAVTLVEIKSTTRPSVEDDFAGFFFAITTSEMLVAQKLGEQYKFALVHLERGTYQLLSLQQLMRRIKAIYPTWSVVLGGGRSE